jgi:iron complex transport system substrate-binding protein
MKKKILSVVMAVAMMSTFVAGCGQNNQEAALQTKAVVESTESASEASVESATATETASSKPTSDRSGNEVTIPDEINSIVSMAPSTTQILIDLGLGDKIVACDTYSYASYADSLNADIPQFDMMTPDQEQIIALGADVVFTTGMSASHGDDVFASVKDAGVCVLDIPSSASLNDIMEDISFIGAATNTQENASLIISDMETAIEEFAAISATIPEEEKKTVLFELFTPSADSPTIYTCGSNTYITEMIELIGATNVAGNEESQWPALSEEACVAMDPQVILTADMYTDDVINVLLTMSGWENVSAIKEKAVYQIDNDTVNRPNHHVISAMIEMAKDIYPGYYMDFVDPFASENSEEKPAA